MHTPVEETEEETEELRLPVAPSLQMAQKFLNARKWMQFNVVPRTTFLL